MDWNHPRVHPQQALAVYVEPLAAGRRVAIFGDASVGLGARLAELGALSVHVWDPDAKRAIREAERAPRGVVVRPFLGDEPEADGEEFDLAVVSDLLLFEDPQDLLARVRVLVGDNGAALVAAPNHESASSDRAPLDYYELFDLVAGEFDDVVMIAQLRFYGVALAELGERQDDEAPSVSVDTQLADTDRSPEAFLALASQSGLRLDPYAIVELPEPLEASPALAELEEPSFEPAPAALRAEALAVEVEELGSRLVQQAEGYTRVVARLDEALLARSARVEELETALVDRTRQLAQLSGEVERARAAAEVGRAVAIQLEDLSLRAERAERALDAAGPELARAAEVHVAEVEAYEGALRDRAQVLVRLEAELVRREKMVRELIDALAEAAHTNPNGPTPPGPPDRPVEPGVEPVAPGSEVALLRHKLDDLALELARREGEAQATAWTIAELERRLQAAVAQASEVNHEADDRAAQAAREDDSRLTVALDELDVLRRALAQEHEARLRAESGEELARARAEIERQAALLNEMRDRPL